MDTYIKLVETFLENPGGFQSIHQISKKIHFPYGTVYNRIHQLGEMGVLKVAPHGKSKLCTLDAKNPMTANLLALGASQRTARYFETHTPISELIQKIREMIEVRLPDQLHCSLVLSYEGLMEVTQGILEGEEPPEPQTFDMFMVIPEENSLKKDFESSLQTLLSEMQNFRLNTMIVQPSTLIGMFREKENDAGISAYHMLKNALLLSGFEKYFSLVLQSFPSQI